MTIVIVERQMRLPSEGLYGFATTLVTGRAGDR